MPTRSPAVAGTFYPADPGKLMEAVEASYLHPLGPGRLPGRPTSSARLVACVCPHAGYEYSGPVAAHSYLHLSSMKEPELAIVVGPNHYGVGSGVSAWSEGDWRTPLGTLKVDSVAARELVSSGVADSDPEAHRMEHSIEVQMPFLQQIFGDRVPILPVSISFQDPETTSLLAEALERVARKRRTILVASSDLTHYEPADQARRKDISLLDEVRKLDPDSFYAKLESLRVTACGYGAIATVVRVCRSMGMTEGRVLKYASSGDTTGDTSSVVGYSSVVFD